MHAPGATTMPPIAVQVAAGSAANPGTRASLRQDVGGIAEVEAERAVEPAGLQRAEMPQSPRLAL